MFFRKMNVALLALCMSATVAVGCSDDPDPNENDMGSGTEADMTGGGGGGNDMTGGGGDDMTGGGGDDMTGGGDDDMAGGGDDDMTGGNDMTGGDDDMTGGDDDMTGDDMAPPAVCGDGMVSGDELCDGQTCPTSVLECDDSNQCTSDSISGSAASCDAQCVNEVITACDGGQSDGCCPAGCTAATDADCMPMNTSGDTGSACAADGDCTDGFCVTPMVDSEFVGGYCSLLNCQDSADCSGDGECLTIDPQNGTTACFDACATDNDCRTDYSCQDVGNGVSVCAPAGNDGTMGNGDAGGACTTDADCGAPGYGFCIAESLDSDFIDGYCATAIECSTGTCGGDNVCIPLFQDGTTACIDGCTTDGDCRTGYSCQDISQNSSGVLTCLPAPVPVTGETGIACMSDADCDAEETCLSEDDGFSGGYCTRQCQADAECPTGSFCSAFGVCADSCSAATPDCRPGYLCGDFDGGGEDGCWRAATGPGAIGATCTSGSDCAGGFDGFCISEAGNGWDEGYCTLNCATDNDCGAGAHCGFIGQSGQGVCVLDCADSMACRGNGTAGYLCSDADEDGSNECAPGATGTGAVGASCGSAADCAGGVDGLCVTDAQGFTGGYCSIQCASDAECGTGSHCAEFGLCVNTCVADTDCRGNDGYFCQNYDSDVSNTLECAPGGVNTNAVPGDSCDDVRDCNGGASAVCAPEDNGFVGGYCLEGCDPADPNACPGDSFCFDFTDPNDPNASPFFLCVDGCTADADCRTPDYSCLQFSATEQGCWIQ